MSDHHLSIVIEGKGLYDETRSHWAFAIHPENENIGTILQVLVIDKERLLYQFDLRKGVDVRSLGSEGSFTLAKLKYEQVSQVRDIISSEPAPRNGTDRCQDWVLGAVIALEEAELVPEGSCDAIANLVGKSAVDVARTVGDRWTATAR